MIDLFFVIFVFLRRNGRKVLVVPTATARLNGTNPDAVVNPSKGYGTPNDLAPSAPWELYNKDFSVTEVKDIMKDAGGWNHKSCYY